MANNKGFNVKEESPCGFKISACGKTENAAKTEWRRKLANHEKHCRKCQNILNPPPFGHRASGRVWKQENPVFLSKKGVSDGFKIEHQDCDPTYLDTLCFEPIPGYDLNEHRPEIVELWGNVKELVSHYHP